MLRGVGDVMIRYQTDDWGFRYVWEDTIQDVEFIVTTTNDVSLFTLAQKLTQRFYSMVCDRQFTKKPRWIVDNDTLYFVYENDYLIVKEYPLLNKYNFLAWYDWQIIAFVDMLNSIAENGEASPFANFLKKYGLSVEQFSLMCRSNIQLFKEVYELKRKVSGKRVARLLREFEREMKKVLEKQNELIAIKRGLKL